MQPAKGSPAAPQLFDDRQASHTAQRPVDDAHQRGTASGAAEVSELAIADPALESSVPFLPKVPHQLAIFAVA